METISYTDGRGRAVTREIKQVVNAEDFLGTAIYPWLIMAANRHLSAADIERYLDVKAIKTDGCYRPAWWIQKRLWMRELPETANARGTKPDADGMAARAVGLMRLCPNMSTRNLAKWLQEQGVNRCRDWVRRHRLDRLPDDAN